MSEDWTHVHSEIDRAFREDTVSSASDEQLQRWLRNICNGAIPNETIRHREIVRGLTINNIQMARAIDNLKVTMRKLNSGNERTQKFVLVLTVVAVIVGAIQAFAAVATILR